MGNYKFKLSNMIPNAWFYKLKEMRKARATSKKKLPTSTKERHQEVSSRTKQTQHYYTRKSYYFTRELATSNNNNYSSPKDNIFHSPKKTPRKSSKHKVERRVVQLRSSPSHKLVNSFVSAGCRCRKMSDDQHHNISTSSPRPENETESRSDIALSTESFDKMLSLSSSCVSRVANSSDKDIIINIDKNSLSNDFDKINNLDMLSGHELPPIITKPFKCMDAKNNVTKEEKSTHVKRYSRNFSGVKVRVNSPRIAGRKIQAHSNTRKSISSLNSSSRVILTNSYAVVKSSFDPQRDFKESMMEMILEYSIKSSKDLEDLLACYLSLNLDEYHGLIIKVFKDIWCDLTDIN